MGNKTIPSENLNLLHLAVYHNQLSVVKVICESVPTLDLAFVGKIPSISGLANESELSIMDPTFKSHHENIQLTERSNTGKLGEERASAFLAMDRLRIG